MNFLFDAFGKQGSFKSYVVGMIMEPCSQAAAPIKFKFGYLNFMNCHYCMYQLLSFMPLETKVGVLNIFGLFWLTKLFYSRFRVKRTKMKIKNISCEFKIHI